MYDYLSVCGRWEGKSIPRRIRQSCFQNDEDKSECSFSTFTTGGKSKRPFGLVLLHKKNITYAELFKRKIGLDFYHCYLSSMPEVHISYSKTHSHNHFHQ